MEIVNVKQCHCLTHDFGYESRFCSKNRYLVFDFNKMRNVNLNICRAYLKSKIQEISIVKNGEITSNIFIASDYDVKETIGLIISQELNLYHSSSYNPLKNYGLNEHIYIRVCDRPSVYKNVSIFDYVSRLMENSDNLSFSWNLEYSFDRFLLVLKRICEYHLQYAKYKKTHNQCASILKRINKKGYNYFYREENKIQLLEFFNTILELKTNIK